jgi:flagellar biosynthesis protein FliQ
MQSELLTDPVFNAVMRESLRIFLVVALPLSAAVIFAGLLAGVLQAFTRVNDYVVSYSLRAIALVSVGYFVYPSAIEGLSRVASLAIAAGRGIR